MSETRNIKVIAEGGLLIGNTFVASGESTTVPRERAESLIRSKVAEVFEGEVDHSDPYALPTVEETAERKAADAEKRAEPASELAEFPGYAQLNKGGLTTVDGLKAYIVDNPNDWAARLELSDEDAAAIGKRLKPSKAKDKAAAEE